MSFLRRHWSVGLAVLVCIVVAKPVRAVPPPDFIINVGSQMVQFFSLALLFLTAIFSSLHQFLRVRFASVHLKTRHWVAALLLIVIISGLGAKVFGMVLERRALAKLQLVPEAKIEETLPVPAVSQHVIVPLILTTTAEILPLKLSNDRFKILLQQATSTFLVLDAREDVEHEYGYFPGSTHIRYADLKAGRWTELPTDRPIIVLCWSGIRGSQVASFLRDKKLAASYLADGANGWVAAGGLWHGSVKFSEQFPEKRYKIAFSKAEMTKRVQNGAILVDAREPAGIAKLPLANAIPISLLSTPSSDLPAFFARIPAGRAVITVCREYVDCFEAKLVGVELERQGHPFLGRYVYTK